MRIHCYECIENKQKISIPKGSIIRDVLEVVKKWKKLLIDMPIDITTLQERSLTLRHQMK